MQRLILFPERPGRRSGYQIAVAADWERIGPQAADTVICYATAGGTEGEAHRFRVMPRPPALAAARVVNLLQRRVSNEVRPGQVAAFTGGGRFDEIFGGEVVFYRALRQLYPQMPLTIRFHNLFLVSRFRNELLRYKLPPAFRLNLYLLTRLEKEILADRNVTPVFITEEELAFFRTVYPRRAAHVWPVVRAGRPNDPVPQGVSGAGRLVWFGGLSQHKRYALDHFIREVYVPLRRRLPGLELHLYGSGTQSMGEPAKSIYGHGFYPGADYPFGGKALFINPDLLGGGVKLKIDDWLRHGLAFISTPYGVEGYGLRAGPHRLIEDIAGWEEALYNYFATNGKTGDETLKNGAAGRFFR